jgi:hypothetical protein
MRLSIVLYTSLFLTRFSLWVLKTINLTDPSPISGACNASESSSNSSNLFYLTVMNAENLDNAHPARLGPMETGETNISQFVNYDPINIEINLSERSSSASLYGTGPAPGYENGICTFINDGFPGTFPLAAQSISAQGRFPQNGSRL